MIFSPVDPSEDCHGEFYVVVNITFAVSSDITLDGVAIDSVVVEQVTYYSEYFIDGIPAWNVSGIFTIPAQGVRRMQSDEHVLRIGLGIERLGVLVWLVPAVLVVVAVSIVVLVVIWHRRRQSK
jgi:hypothetical protein